MARDKRSSLYSRLDALEDRLISEIDRNVARLSTRDREHYEQWRRQARTLTYEQVIDGETGPALPWWIRDQVFKDITVSENMHLDEVREIYERVARR